MFREGLTDLKTWARLFYFKEYTNETDESAGDFILTSYDGAERKTGLKIMDNKTKDYPVQSAIIFVGNLLPMG